MNIMHKLSNAVEYPSDVAAYTAIIFGTLQYPVIAYYAFFHDVSTVGLMAWLLSCYAINAMGGMIYYQRRYYHLKKKLELIPIERYKES